MTEDPQILPVAKEEVRLSRQRHMTGHVRVSTRTESLDQTLSADLTDTEVEVVRVPVGRRVDAVPDVVTQDGVTIVPVVEERVVMTRVLYLREEVHIRQIAHKRRQDIPVTTRHQTVDIERSPAAEATRPANPVAKDRDDDL